MPTSERQRQANRQNARKSTGPRTAAGRARSARNALRHGLAAAAPAWPQAPEARELTCLLAGGRSDSLGLAEARDMAEATLEIARIRRLRVAIIDRALARPVGAPADRSDNDSRRPADDSDGSERERLALAYAGAAGELAALDRYERRALSRRKMAARRLDRT